jgi:glycosyltransferase involved in cell wall biosynthesis
MVNFDLQLKLQLFRGQLLLQRIVAAFVDCLPAPPPSRLRATAFVASLNTLPALRVALGTLRRVEGSHPMPILIADNASKDGSQTFLQAYSQTRSNVDLILHDGIIWHGLWIDHALQQASADLLFVLDSDLIFFGHRLFDRCLHYMESHPECWILQADSWDHLRDIGHPSNGCINEEKLSTWFLCIRTGLRDRIDTSFVAVFPDQQPPREGRAVMSDTGAKVIHQMRSLGLEIHALPRPWRWQFHHVGSLSWLQWANASDNSWLQLKQAKLRLLDRWGLRIWSKVL